MIFCRNSKRVSCLSVMISQLNHLFVAPAACGNPTTFLSPSFLSVRNPCFRYYGTMSIQSHIALAANRISRVSRTDAEDALFDYLHCTRGFHFTDAEHISKNSPYFLQTILSKVENDQNVSRALSKLFRYHPINEFEPFFESLGLSPSELTSLLPQNFMFLSDDHLMLDNYHVLCNYGIPRSKIGKLYKEANEIFRYRYGVLAMKLRAYEELGLSQSIVIKLVICCPSLLVGGVNNEFALVLEKLKGLGFENNWIGGYLSDNRTYSWNRMLDTMSFLSDVGYSEQEMGIVFKTNPALLFDGSGKGVYVLVGRLLKMGLKIDVVYSLFIENPQILSPKFSKNLWKALHFMSEIEMEFEDIAKIVSTHLPVLGLHSLKGPKTVLRKFSGDKYSLCQLIKDEPLKLLSLASKSRVNGVEQLALQNPGTFLDKTTFLLRLGYVENSDGMAKALKLFRGRGDQLQERFDCLVQAGLDSNVVANMIRQAPSVLNQTKDVLEKKISALKNSLGYPMESIVAFPAYLCYDMERINIRFSMYIWLRKIGAAKPRLSVSTLLACSDARFVRYFVNIHPEGPAKWENMRKTLPTS